MGQKSTITRLPEEILDRLHELLRDPRVTQLEATAKINAILAAEGGEEQLSKSAVNRYALQMERVGEKVQQSREIAKMWIGKLGAAPQGEMGHLLNESLRSMIFEFQLKLQDMELDEESMPMFSKFMRDMSLILQRLEAASTMNVKREAEIRRQALEAAAKAVGETAREAGVSSETIARIRRDVLRMNQ
jgi:hypothetical protein